jgi:hypothetical protein
VNKNLLLWAIIIIVIALTYIGIFFLGRNSVKPPEGKVEVRETIKFDTVSVIKRIYVNRLVEVETKGDSIKSYSDKIVGDTLDTKYEIFHSVIDSQKTIRSWWKVNIEPRFRTITKVVTRDSIQTKIDTKYLPVPWFLNNYFYVSITTTLIAILAIIF